MAQFNLGVAYSKGEGVARDHGEAIKWCRKAAEQDFAPAQFSLGLVYEFARGVSQDYVEALKWYRKAAEQSHTAAQLNLGVMYDVGKGVPQDYAEAMKWYRKAAERGSVGARNNLARMFARGEGVPQDYVEAHKWYNLAASESTGKDRDRSVRNRDLVAAKMTSAQVAEAQRRAKEWQASNVDGTLSVSPPPAPETNATLSPRSTGTSFAVTPDGHLLTAHHVATAGKDLKVRLSDGRTVNATVAKSLRSVDLAVLKVDVPTPDYLELAESGSVSTGSKVFTLGFPAAEFLGNEPKFTEGNISSMSGPGDDVTFLQISVPIQPGNSGGPLVNENGKVVGIVAAAAAVEIFFGATGSLPQNVNWAVNADFARALLNQPKVSSGATPHTRQAVIEKTKKAIAFVMAFE